MRLLALNLQYVEIVFIFISCCAFKSGFLILYMRLTDNQRFVLFVLGKIYEESDKRLKDRLLQVSISKPAFIEIVKKGGLTEKGERALYRNLEDLEKLNYIDYENKTLKLNKKGLNQYTKINRELKPYLNIIKIIESENLVRRTNKARTTFVGFS